MLTSLTLRRTTRRIITTHLQTTRRTFLTPSYPPLTIPARTSWDVLSSAIKASTTLLFSTEKRDECLKLINDGVIKANVLGIPMTLALYNDLSSPLFEKHGFDVKEFQKGASVAVESFNEMQGRLMNIFHDDLVATKEKEGSDDDNDDDESQKIRDIQALLSGTSMHDMERATTEEWMKDAKDNPDGPRGKLLKMTTPEYFNMMNFVFKATNSLGKSANVRYIPGSTEITHMALLSARVMEFPPEPISGDDVNDLTDEEREKNDKLLNNIKPSDDDLPVAAQVEILYDMTQSFTAEELVPGMEKSGEKVDGKEKVTRPTLVVAVFEGWLKGSSPLRWRIALNRPPWEFN